MSNQESSQTLSVKWADLQRVGRQAVPHDRAMPQSIHVQSIFRSSSFAANSADCERVSSRGWSFPKQKVEKVRNVSRHTAYLWRYAGSHRAVRCRSIGSGTCRLKETLHCDVRHILRVTRQGLKRFSICHKGAVADMWKIHLLKHTQEKVNPHSLL